MSRVGFWDIFEPMPDGSVRPRRAIKIAGVLLNPGTTYAKGILFSGFDLFQYYGRDLEIDETPDQPPTLTGIYRATDES